MEWRAQYKLSQDRHETLHSSRSTCRSFVGASSAAASCRAVFLANSLARPVVRARTGVLEAIQCCCVFADRSTSRKQTAKEGCQSLKDGFSLTLLNSFLQVMAPREHRC